MNHTTSMTITLALSLLAPACAHRPLVRSFGDGTKLGKYPGDGGVLVGKKAEGGDGLQVCLAPPAQAVKTVKIDIDNGLKASGAKALEAALTSKVARDEALHSLYEQGHATLYMQFMAYRLCEAKINGWIDDVKYADKLSELQTMAKDLIKYELDRTKEVTKQVHVKEVTESLQTTTKALRALQTEAAAEAGLLPAERTESIEVLQNVIESLRKTLPPKPTSSE